MWRHIRENFGRYVLCLLLMTVGLGAFAVKTQIDVEFWVSQAATEEGKWQFGGAALVFCFASLIFTCAVASRLREKITPWNVVGTLLAGVVLLYVTAYGMASIVGFGARERINPYAIAQAKIAAEKKAVEETNALHKTYVDRQLSYLQEQGRKARGPKAKQAAYTAAGDIFGSIEVKAEPVDIVTTDPQAVALHKLFPEYSIEQIQNTWIAAFGVGLLLVELFGMGFAVGMWPRYAAAVVAEVSEEIPISDILRPSAEVIHPPQFQREVEPVYEQTALDLDVDAHMTANELIHEFWKSETRPSPGARLRASAVYRAYLSWCEENDYSAVTQQMFGRVSGKFIGRIEGANWQYTDRALLRRDAETETTDSLMVA